MSDESVAKSVAKSVRVAIVEDEPVIARRLSRLIRQILGHDLASIATLPSFDDAREHIAEHPIDLLFLDLNLHGADGFELLAHAVAESFATIVVSAHTDQALRAFEYGVLDFVPKPFGESRLRQAIERWSARAAATPARFLAVREAGDIALVAVDEIVFISGAGDYSELSCVGGAKHLHAKTLATLETCLPGRFVRIHRSHLVDFERVERLRSASGGRYWVELATGDELPVARGRVGDIRKRLA